MDADISELFAVSQCVKRFYQHLDSGNVDAIVGLLDDDVRWHRPGGWVEGVSACRAALEARPSEKLIRHLVINEVIERISGDEFEARYSLVSYSATVPEGGPAPETPTASVFDCVDRLRCSGGSFKFTYRSPSAVFLRPGLANAYG